MVVIPIPSMGVPQQVTGREVWDARQPTDRQVWGVCPYLRDLEKCMGCSEWKNDERFGKVKIGCRVLAEEACRVVMAAMPLLVDNSNPKA